MGIQNPKFGAGAIQPSPVRPGEDGRIPCARDVRPSEEDAVKHGFESALDWYSYSTGGERKDPKLVKQHFDQLPKEIDPDDDALNDDEIREFFKKALGPGNESQMVHLDDDTEEFNLAREVGEELSILDNPYLIHDVEILNRLGDDHPVTHVVTQVCKEEYGRAHCDAGESARNDVRVAPHGQGALRTDRASCDSGCSGHKSAFVPSCSSIPVREGFEVALEELSTLRESAADTCRNLWFRAMGARAITL